MPGESGYEESGPQLGQIVFHHALVGVNDNDSHRVLVEELGVGFLSTFGPFFLRSRTVDISGLGQRDASTVCHPAAAVYSRLRRWANLTASSSPI